MVRQNFMAGSMWKSTTAHLMAAGKQKKEVAQVPTSLFR
jgi:hypothetical protein